MATDILQSLEEGTHWMAVDTCATRKGNSVSTVEVDSAETIPVQENRRQYIAIDDSTTLNSDNVSALEANSTDFLQSLEEGMHHSGIDDSTTRSTCIGSPLEIDGMLVLKSGENVALAQNICSSRNIISHSVLKKVSSIISLWSIKTQLRASLKKHGHELKTAASRRMGLHSDCSSECQSDHDKKQTQKRPMVEVSPWKCLASKPFADVKQGGISDVIYSFSSICQSQSFLNKLSPAYPHFAPNPYLTKDYVGYAKFMLGLTKLGWNDRHDAQLGLVFHGTSEGFIFDILRNGLSPQLRLNQRYGPGEYFSTDPCISRKYCLEGTMMLVFVVVLPPVSARRQGCPDNFVVVSNNEHQLPLGLIMFSDKPKVPRIEIRLAGEEFLEKVGCVRYEEEQKLRRMNQAKLEPGTCGRLAQMTLSLNPGRMINRSSVDWQLKDMLTAKWNYIKISNCDIPINNKYLEDRREVIMKDFPSCWKVVRQLEKLKSRKTAMRGLLKEYDMNFAMTLHRVPSKQEKEPIRHLYEEYHSLNECIDAFERDMPKGLVAKLMHEREGAFALMPEAKTLMAEKSLLYHQLRSFEQDFFEHYGRQVSTFDDIQPAKPYYWRYRDIKMELKSLFSREVPGYTCLG